MGIDHLKLPVSDLDATRAFYSAALAPFGWGLIWDEAPVLGFGAGGGAAGLVIAFQRHDPPIARAHVAFSAESTGQVDAFHAAALEAGGSDNGAPGERPYGIPYYAAFVLDPDGHNVEAVFKGG
jgi:catechol 2,3-dioxygenase-like lactoylglutathione lyase family enzyme